MRLNSANWLAPLRARKHVLLRVLLPMLAASALSAPACAAMLAAAATPEVQHAHGGAHVAHPTPNRHSQRNLARIARSKRGSRHSATTSAS